MKESDLKDKILKTISRGDPDKKGVYYTVASVSEYLKVDFDFAYHCCEQMFNDGIIKMFTLNTSLPDRVIQFTPKGKVFYTQEGGYTKQEKLKFRSSVYSILKVVLTAAASLAIIILTYLNYKATDKANDNKTVEDSLKTVIRTQESKIESLKAKITPIYPPLKSKTNSQGKNDPQK